MAPKTSNYTVHVNPTPQKALAIALAGPLSQEALLLSRRGDHKSAEQLHQKVLKAKIPAFGPDSLEVAFTENSIGEQQLRQGKLDEAEKSLRHAVKIRNRNPQVIPFDAAVTRENLAHVLEAKGDLHGAREVRRSGGTHAIACSYYYCPGQAFRLSHLRTCGGCHSALYCSATCQMKDWTQRHKKLCRKAKEN